jgi:hypothetical protein
MHTDAFLTWLWICALQRLPPRAIVVMLDTLPSRYGPRVRA